MSAFGGASMSASAGMRSSAAPAMDELDAEDDFLDDETTKVQQLPSVSEFPDAAATVVASQAPFVAERLRTPVVPAALESSSPLEQAVPDLFGPDSVRDEMAIELFGQSFWRPRTGPRSGRGWVVTSPACTRSTRAPP